MKGGSLVVVVVVLVVVVVQVTVVVVVKSWPELVNNKLRTRTGNTNSEPGLVNTNLGPGSGAWSRSQGAGARAGSQSKGRRQGKTNTLYINLDITIYTFFINNTFISNSRLKLVKNQAKAKQHPEAKLVLFENYSLFSSKLSYKIIGDILRNLQKISTSV